MKIQRLLIVLTLVNLALLIFTLAQIRPAVAEGVPPVLRGRALEIVDEQGRVRASLNVLPAKTQPNGETYPETEPRRPLGHERHIRDIGSERHGQLIETEKRGWPRADRQAVAWKHTPHPDLLHARRGCGGNQTTVTVGSVPRTIPNRASPLGQGDQRQYGTQHRFGHRHRPTSFRAGSSGRHRCRRFPRCACPVPCRYRGRCPG